MLRNLLPFVLAFSVGLAGGVLRADWPQWRGPSRNGVGAEGPALAAKWPKKGPPKVWASEEVLSAGWGGYGSVSVAGGRAYVYCNRKRRVPFPQRTLTAKALKQLGHFPDRPPAELLAVIEKARVSEERRNVIRKDLNNWLKAWAEKNLTEEQRKTFGAFARDRLYRAKKALALELLEKLATIRDKEFPDQAALGKWFADNGIGEADKKVVLRHVRTYNDEGDDLVFCFDAADGKTLWKYTGPGKAHSRGLSGTPCVAEGKVCVVGSTGELYCLDAEKGELAWKVPTGGSGVHSSPLIVEGKVVVQIGRLTAFDLADGKLAWKARKVGGGNPSPACWRKDGKTCILANTGRDVACVALADGKVLWTVPGGGGSTPAVGGDYLAVATGKKEVGLVGYRMAAEKAEKLWNVPTITDPYASPIVHDGHVYVVSNGQAWCVDAATGKVAWQEKVGATNCSSPALAGGRLITILRRGGLAAVTASPEKAELIGTAKLGITDYTSPAVAGGNVYLRLGKAVGCFDLTKAPEEPAPKE